MKILIVHEVDWIRKITYEIHHLSEMFSLLGHEVYALDIPNPKTFSLDIQNFKTVKNYHRIYDKSNVTLFRTPTIPIKGLNKIIPYFFSHYFIKKILKKYRIDIVFIYSVAINARGAIKACKELEIPIIHRTFDIVHELILENYLRDTVFKIEKEIYPKFDNVIANTPDMKTWSEEMGAKNVVVIEQGVDSNIMKPLKKDKELQKQLGINDQDKIVMYLGTTQSFCGLDFLIEKIPIMLEKIPDFKLLIVGDGELLEALKKQVKTLGIEKRVIFTGFIPYVQVSRYSSLAKLCVNTFRITNMTKKLSPVKIFDLLACGKTVIATPLEGLLYDFPKIKNVLIYSDLNNIDSSIISALEDDKMESFGIRGREYVEKNFSWKKVSNKMLNEFSKVIEATSKN